ncbi:thioredoxin [Nonlabens tegetincola]
MLIQFWAEWCAPCRAMIPIVDQFAQEHEGEISVARVDIDQNPDLSVQYRVTAVPTFVIARGDRVIEAFSGAMPLKPFTAKVQQALAA